MKLHSTNYFDTLIEVATDTKVVSGTKPPTKTIKTIAEIEYELISKNPYKYTSDDVLFQVYAIRNKLQKAELKETREQYFSIPQPCFRSSPLTKSYGFGIHSNSDGKIALFGMETKEYQKFLSDKKITKLKAMKSSK